MPSNPFDLEYQKRVRRFVGGLLPDVKSSHVAEALAAGYGYHTHASLLKAIHSATESGRVLSGSFDADRFERKLEEFGATCDAMTTVLIRSMMSSIVAGEFHVPTPAPAVHAVEAAFIVRAARMMIQSQQWDDAAGLLGSAISTSDARLKPEIVGLLELVSEHSKAARANLAIALLTGDGVPPQVKRAEKIFADLAHEPDTGLSGLAYNWLGHIARGAFGKAPDMRKAVEYFEIAGRLGYAEAAFNAALLVQDGARGLPSDAKRAMELYKIGAKLGHARSMTNLAFLLMQAEPKSAVTLLERAAELGDANAVGFLNALDGTLDVVLDPRHRGR